MSFLFVRWCTLGLLVASAPVLGEEPHVPADDSRSTCVNVTVNDHPVLAYDCLDRQLAAPAASRAGLLPPRDAVAELPSNQQAGQFNFSALRNRMGANLGRSVQPQRPAPILAAPGLPHMPPGAGH